MRKVSGPPAGDAPPAAKPDASSAVPAVTGRWDLRGISLTLHPAEGAAIRRIAFPDDDPKTVVKPDRMFFGGLVYKRRP